MLTKEKLKIYKKYNGDEDTFSRTASKREKTLINTEDWKMVYSFKQDLQLLRNNLASESYIQKIGNEFNEMCDAPETIIYFKEMFKRMASPYTLFEKFIRIFKSHKY